MSTAASSAHFPDLQYHSSLSPLYLLHFRDLESEVEHTRQEVVQNNRKLRIADVQRFADQLTDVGENAAELKEKFVELQERLKCVMATEMDRVVREERFLKEEPGRIDAVLRRCKKMAHTMVTMKKLALVQDHRQCTADNDVHVSADTPVQEQSVTAQLQTAAAEQGEKRAANSPSTSQLDSPLQKQETTVESGKRAEQHGVLDTLLEELQTVAATSLAPNANGHSSDEKTTTNRLEDIADGMERAKESRSLPPSSDSTRQLEDEEEGMDGAGWRLLGRTDSSESVASEPANPKPPIPPPPAKYATVGPRRPLQFVVSHRRQYDAVMPVVAAALTDAINGYELANQKGNSNSSSESVNSQEGLLMKGEPNMAIPPPPPPPPPPPRDHSQRSEYLGTEMESQLQQQKRYYSNIAAGNAINF